MNQALEIRRANPEMETQIADFFRALAKSEDSDFFQPHPFTIDEAHAIANYYGRDFYAFILYDGNAIGYGMLRGWDEGYVIPSLGISIHPDFRGVGIGLLLIHYLHAVALLMDCKKIRLRVNKENYRARRLYEKLGYQFEESSGKYLVGFAQLGQKH